MLEEDRQRFLIDLGDASDADRADRAMKEALGVQVESLDRLVQALQSDLDSTSHGYGWWTRYGDDARRILVSEHVSNASTSVSTNLVEAALHLLEARDSEDRVRRKFERMVRADGTFELPQPRFAADFLPETFTLLHMAGFFRAIGSAFDCLAATIIGVAACPQNVLRADFLHVRRWLSGETQKSAPRHRLQLELLDVLAEAITATGPVQWLEWCDEYRNMLVHRGRRTHLRMPQTEAIILDADSRPVPKTNPILLLLREPRVSNIEAVRQASAAQMVLGEAAVVTMDGVLASARSVIESIADALVTLWERRRSDPDLLVQPLTTQWPAISTSPTQQFQGYAVGSIDLSTLKKMIMNPRDHERLKASAIQPHQEGVWPPIQRSRKDR